MKLPCLSLGLAYFCTISNLDEVKANRISDAKAAFRSSIIALAYFLDSKQVTISPTTIKTIIPPTTIATILATESENLASYISLMAGAFSNSSEGFINDTRTQVNNVNDDSRANLIHMDNINLCSLKNFLKEINIQAATGIKIVARTTYENVTEE